MKKLDSKARNCPNCGAPLEAGKIKCDYCGTSYYDLSTISFNEPMIITFKINDIIYHTKVVLNMASVTYNNSSTCLPVRDADNKLITKHFNAPRTFELKFMEVLSEE